MNMTLKANGLVHEILRVLELGEFQPSEIEARLVGRFTTDTLRHMPEQLARAEFSGYIEVNDNKISITASGTQLCSRLNSNAQELERAKLVKANLLHIPKDHYDGAELRKVAVRPGALDYVKYPSLINGKRVYN